MPQYADVLGSLSQGQQFVDGLFTQRANREAGAALAAGDYGSAAGTMFRSGNLSGGQGIRDQQQANQTRQTEQDAATRARRLATTQQIVRATRAVRDSGGNVAAEISRIEPAILAMGTDLNEWNQIKTSVLSNPAVLDDIENIVGQQLRELEIVNYGSGRGGVTVDKATGEIVSQFAPTPEPIINNNVIRDPVTFDVIADDRDPEYIQRDPTKDLLDVSPAAGGTRGGSSSRTTPDAILQGILEREGGFVASDGRSGAPANFGINQRANPDIDVANLTRPQAEQIYRERYINPIIEAGVEGPILDAVVDFGVNAGVNRSLDFWRRSNGDIDEFNRLRLAHYRSLPDYQQNGRSWERRVQETTPGSSGSVSAGGGPRVVSQAQAAPPPQLTPAQQAQQSATQFNQERSLRNDLGNSTTAKTLASVRPFIGTIGNIARRANAGEEISAQDDLALIFAYMKMLDPGSVVREGEFANAQNTGGIDDRIVNAYNNARNGTRLNNRQRNEFFRSATGVMNGYEAPFRDSVDRQRSLAESYGLNADRVAPANAPTAPERRRPQTNTGVVPFDLTPAQLTAWRNLGQNGGDPSRPLGDRLNPRPLNPAANASARSWQNIRSGDYFYHPDGTIRRKP